MVLRIYFSVTKEKYKILSLEYATLYGKEKGTIRNKACICSYMKKEYRREKSDTGETGYFKEGG